MMDGGPLRQGMARMRGGNWSSVQCVQRVEEMLSKAIVNQEDLLGLLMIHSPEGASLDTHTGHMSTADAISPQVLRALKAKLENSMDWCHLALCRLREIVLHTSPTPSMNPTLRVTASGEEGSILSHQSSQNQYNTIKSEASKLANPSPRLNLPSPLSPLRVLLRKENLAPHPLTGQAPISSSVGRSSGAWSPRSFFFAETSQLSAAAQPVEEEASPQPQSQPMAIVGPNAEHQQGQNFARLPNLGLESDWPLVLAEAPVSSLPPPPLGSDETGTDPHQSSSSCQLNIDISYNGGSVADFKELVDCEDRSYVTKARGLRSRGGLKSCDVRKLSGGDSKVVFQELKPGIDTKKGIPDDGHRGWKKYGNKAIQNSNFCRGYYKCSVKECRAKKMVQPTDKDPSIFEVTYVGKHTCSSTMQRRHRSRAGPPPVQVEEVEEVQAETRFGSGTSEEAASPDVATKSAVTKDVVMTTSEWKKRAIGALELEENSRVTRSSSGCEEEEEDERKWGGSFPKRLREDGVHDNVDSNSFLNNMTRSVLTTASEEREHGGDGEATMDTYLQQSSRHHQAVYAFQEPLLWPDFMDTNLSPSGGHKSVSVDSVSP